MSSWLTEKEKIEIVKLYQEGLSSVEIGRLFNRAKCTIRQLLIKQGVKLRTERRRSPLDLTNIKFGELTALKRGKDLPTGRNKVTWDCNCSCGRTVNVTRSNLTSGNCMSCGCKKSLPYGEAAFNRTFGHYKNNAKKKKREFLLSRDEFREITSSDCFYCGCSPNQKGNKTKKNNGHYLHNGIDRIDSTKGYVNGNVVSCCYKCNYSKRSQSFDNFLKWVNSIYNNLNSKGLL